MVEHSTHFPKNKGLNTNSFWDKILTISVSITIPGNFGTVVAHLTHIPKNEGLNTPTVSWIKYLMKMFK